MALSTILVNRVALLLSALQRAWPEHSLWSLFWADPNDESLNNLAYLRFNQIYELGLMFFTLDLVTAFVVILDVVVTGSVNWLLFKWVIVSLSVTWIYALCATAFTAVPIGNRMYHCLCWLYTRGKQAIDDLPRPPANNANEDTAMPQTAHDSSSLAKHPAPVVVTRQYSSDSIDPLRRDAVSQWLATRQAAINNTTERSSARDSGVARITTRYRSVKHKVKSTTVVLMSRSRSALSRTSSLETALARLNSSGESESTLPSPPSSPPAYPSTPTLYPRDSSSDEVPVPDVAELAVVKLDKNMIMMRRADKQWRKVKESLGGLKDSVRRRK